MHPLASRLPDLASIFVGCGVRLNRNASIRPLGTDGAAGYGAFRGGENVSFPFRFEEEEKRLLDALLARGRFDAAAPESVLPFLRLVMEGILSVRFAARWLGGAEAARPAIEGLGLLPEEDRHATLIAGRLLRSGDPDHLRHLLYSSGRWPADQPTRQAAQRIVAKAGSLRPPAPWRRISPENPAWIAWARDVAPGAPLPPRANAKLYVSLGPLPLEARLDRLLEEVFCAPGVREAKLAATVPALHRTDALVVYCESFERLPSVARRLAPLAAGSVPSRMTFAPAFAASPNLFWGIDPRQPEHLVYGESWRRAVCGRAAQVAARLRRLGPPDPMAAARGALFRFHLDGVDPTTWIPPYARDLA